MIKVTLDDSVMRHWPKEECVDCSKPTAYWAPRGEYPLCKSCARSSDAGHGKSIYLKRIKYGLKYEHPSGRS